MLFHFKCSRLESSLKHSVNLRTWSKPIKLSFVIYILFVHHIWRWWRINEKNTNVRQNGSCSPEFLYFPKYQLTISLCNLLCNFFSVYSIYNHINTITPKKTHAKSQNGPYYYSGIIITSHCYAYRTII